jgi:hypothetical protein
MTHAVNALPTPEEELFVHALRMSQLKRTAFLKTLHGTA